MPQMLMSDTDNAKQELIDKIGDVSGLKVFENRVLVAVYVRSEVTKGGIILTTSTRDEDKYQGKVGLVLKMGPSAFKDDDRVSFHDKVEVGDWVLFRTADSWPFDLNKPENRCRIIDDQDIRGTLTRPDMVW